MSQRRPNFFIVGAPKCGTTSLHNYLDQHPDIYMTQTTKEPAYFCTDLKVNEFRRARDLESYLALFAGATTQRRLGDATVWNLYSRVAAQNIREFDPHARIIIMLRNPADAMYSLHGQFLWSCNEDIIDFDEALAAEPDRRRGLRIPPEAHSPDGLIYSDVFRFSEQVRRYFDTFGRENVQVILFDDFVKDTAGIYRQTLAFLDVDPSFQPTFEIVNAAKAVPMGFNRFFGRRPRLRAAVHRLVPVALKRKLIDVVPRIVPTVDRPSRIPPETRQRLLPTITEDIHRLSELLGRDLTHWCR